MFRAFLCVASRPLPFGVERFPPERENSIFNLPGYGVCVCDRPAYSLQLGSIRFAGPVGDRRLEPLFVHVRGGAGVHPHGGSRPAGDAQHGGLPRGPGRRPLLPRGIHRQYVRLQLRSIRPLPGD